MLDVASRTYRHATPGQLIADSFAPESRAIESTAESVAVSRCKVDIVPHVGLETFLLGSRPHLIMEYAVDRLGTEDLRAVELSSSEQGAQNSQEGGRTATKAGAAIVLGL